MSDQPVALVTGAARGIGREVAAQLAGAGFRVVLTARDVAAPRAGSAVEGERLDMTVLFGRRRVGVRSSGLGAGRHR